MTQSTLQLLHASTAGGHDTNVTVAMNTTSDARVMLVIVGRGSRAARVVWRLRGTISCFSRECPYFPDLLVYVIQSESKECLNTN